MNKKIVKLSILVLLLTHVSYATNENKNPTEVNEKPVDEALEHKPKEDSIKGGDKLKDKYHEAEISLSTIEDSYKLERSDLNFPPYKCFIYHPNTKITEIGTSNSSKIDFEIKKSLLKDRDIIVVTNSLNVIHKDNPFGKFVIEAIQVVK